MSPKAKPVLVGCCRGNVSTNQARNDLNDQIGWLRSTPCRGFHCERWNLFLAQTEAGFAVDKSAFNGSRNVIKEHNSNMTADPIRQPVMPAI